MHFCAIMKISQTKIESFFIDTHFFIIPVVLICLMQPIVPFVDM